MTNNELPSLEELEKSIKKARERSEDGVAGPQIGAMRVSVDLLAGIMVGAFFGFYLDKWLETWPFMFMICFCLGVAGGVMNIYRSVKMLSNKDE